MVCRAASVGSIPGRVCAVSGDALTCIFIPVSSQVHDLAGPYIIGTPCLQTVGYRVLARAIDHTFSMAIHLYYFPLPPSPQAIQCSVCIAIRLLYMHASILLCPPDQVMHMYTVNGGPTFDIIV